MWDPDPTPRAIIARALYLRGHEGATYGDRAEALAAWRSEQQPLVIAGWRDDGRTLSLCQEIRDSPGGAEVVVLVAGRDLSDEALARIIACADDVVPPELGALLARIAIAERWVKGAEHRRVVQEQLVHQALHDPLTGLPNRALFADRLEIGLRAAERQGQTLAVLIMDLDRFKAVNDTYGHTAGDTVLREAGARLRSALRASDTVARIGGDEFAAVLPGIGDRESATAAARKIVDILVGPYQLDGKAADVGVSVGLALFPPHGADPDALLRQADTAMYAAKRVGGGLAVASGEPVDEAPIARTPIDPRAASGLDSSSGPGGSPSTSQSELLRTMGQDLDHSGLRAHTIIAEGDGYRVREDGTELWFPIEELVRESRARALRRHAH